MKALSISKKTPAQEAVLCTVPTPEPQDGWVLIRVCGRGLNHSEQVLRLGEIEAPYITKPVIPGIECVGEIANSGNTSFVQGQKVCAFMGGMGRSFNGSYAEYVCMPAHHVFSIPESASTLSWETLAAIPETFYTAWGSLFRNLRLEPSDTLLVRGGTCALGVAAIQLACALGCTVIASAKSPQRLDELTSAGAHRALVDNGQLAKEQLGANKVLELVGSSTLRDSLQCAKPSGIVCHTGILGGEEPLQQFNPLSEIPNGVYLSGFHSNWPKQDDVDALFNFIATHHIQPSIAQVFPFEELPQALMLQDKGGFLGKIVVC